MPTDVTTGSSEQGWVGSILYRSKAVQPPTPAELDAIVREAQSRNSRLGITGMLLYENGRYLQTLEGPPIELDQIWASVRQDNRHTEIEVLSEQLAPGRLFSGWHMQLFDRNKREGRQSPSRAEALAREIPTVAAHALATDHAAIATLVQRLTAAGYSADTLVQDLIEPVARALGDAWLTDECTDLDLSIGLATLRRGSMDVFGHKALIRPTGHSILLVTAPEEPHLLGSTLLADLFFEAGWRTDLAFPTDTAEVVTAILSAKADAIDIALSDAMPRHDRVNAFRALIADCRAALPDRHLIVSVGGRAFADGPFTADMVGADHARISAVGTVGRLTRLVERHHSRWPEEAGWDSLPRQ
jgi:hypothetical protein